MIQHINSQVLSLLHRNIIVICQALYVKKKITCIADKDFKTV
jgi:hypothetical protein